ncbi:hypothetical protein U91I_00875 [alpha proteobacterium U9-1i]|nr:hypothetical protein U91I_00875 [alpha proteobacterium U9-1i]
MVATGVVGAVVAAHAAKNATPIKLKNRMRRTCRPIAAPAMLDSRVAKRLKASSLTGRME